MSEAIKAIVCFSGRCSSWGKSWKRHLYSETAEHEDCLRCGMNRKEQWDEDKSLKLVTGAYKPLQPRPPKKIRNGDQVMYCAVGDYGIENVFPTEKECRKWITEQSEEHEFDTEDYEITTYTRAQLDAMPEV